MNLEQFRAFSQILQHNLETDSRVLGLIFLGSSAELNYLPDNYSDHDFYVVTLRGHEENFLQNLSWLPYYENILINFRKTPYGRRVVFRNRHQVEFSIMEERVLFRANVNEYRIAFDKAHIGEILKHRLFENLSEDQIHGLLSVLHTGIARYHRGEILNGEDNIKHTGLTLLLALLSKYLPAENNHLLDNLDPSRRFEKVFPQLSQEIKNALSLEGLETARHLLTIADRELSGRIPDYPTEASELIMRFIDEAPS
jgi:lincosamide nucleotidyltransferase B/F